MVLNPLERLQPLALPRARMLLSRAAVAVEAATVTAAGRSSASLPVSPVMRAQQVSAATDAAAAFSVALSHIGLGVWAQ